jgi:hypothetical protein
MAVIAGNADPAGQSMPAEAPADVTANVRTRRARVRIAAAARGVPLATIIAAVGVVAFAYLAGKLIYRLSDVVLLMVVAGFIALILNPVVGGTTRRRASGCQRGLGRQAWSGPGYD